MCEPTATPQESNQSSPAKRSSVRRASAIRKASNIAKEANVNAKAKDATDFVKITRAALEFQIASLMAELELLKELAKLSDQEKLEALFALLDKDGDGNINSVELADGLRKVRGDVNFEESIALAITRVAAFDKDGDAKLNIQEFQNYMETFAECLGCSFHEISEMLVMSVLFSDSGNNAVENVVAAMNSDAIDEACKEVEREEEEVSRQVVTQRMRALFDLFDADGNGTLDFQEVVLGMYKVTQGIEKASQAAITALLMFDKEGSRSLDFEQFSRFIINVVAAIDSIAFHDLADMITRTAAEGYDITVDELTEMFAMDNSMKYVMNLTEATQEEVDKLKGSSIGRVNKLFDFWDLDQNGFIDFHELALGMRKFEETTSLKKSVDESIKVMQSFDTNADQKLDRNEFALFVVKFANIVGADLHEMIDFMIVTTALKENTDGEKKYIQSIGASDIYYWGW